MRTIVVSDIHGYPELLENAIEHSGFRRGIDRLVFAGDFLDGGRNADRVLELLDEVTDVALIGNHELATMLGTEIHPHNAESDALAEPLLDRVLDADGSFGGRWTLASAEQGVFVCHSCVSAAFEREFEEAGRDVAAFVERLNREFRTAVARAAAGEESVAQKVAANRLFGGDGPLWYRPLWLGQEPPLAGLVQVVGHTARELYRPEGLAGLDALGIHLIAPDPRDAEWGDAGPHWLAHAYRYGVIEDGAVRVESWEGE